MIDGERAELYDVTDWRSSRRVSRRWGLPGEPLGRVCGVEFGQVEDSAAYGSVVVRRYFHEGCPLVRLIQR